METQAISQLDLARAISVLVIMDDIARMMEGVKGYIKAWRNRTPESKLEALIVCQQALSRSV